MRIWQGLKYVCVYADLKQNGCSCRENITVDQVLKNCQSNYNWTLKNWLLDWIKSLALWYRNCVRILKVAFFLANTAAEAIQKWSQKERP